MIKKIKLGSSLAALVLFFLPWVDIQCSEKSLATQTGLQVITGDGTPNEEMSNSPGQSSDSDESMGYAPLVGLAFLAVTGAAIFSFLALFKGGKSAETLSSVLPAIALLLLLFQLTLDFPVENEMAKSMSEKTEEAKDGELGALGESVAKGVMMNIKVKTTLAFYLELLALGIPTLLLLNGFIDKHKKNESS